MTSLSDTGDCDTAFSDRLLSMVLLMSAGFSEPLFVILFTPKP